jgi:chlorophyll synthase
MFLSILISQINYLAGYAAFTDLALAFLYSSPSIRLKRFPLVKGGVLVAHTLIIPFTVANLILGKSPLHGTNPIIPLFLLGLAVHTVQDIGDIEGDKMMGDKTLPIILGVKKSVSLSLILLIISAGLLAVYDAPYKVLGLAIIAAQIPLLSVLLFRVELWKYVFWVTSVLAAGVVASILYGCCG